MDRRVVCVDIESGSQFDDCRAIARIGYELRDGVYERSPEYINRRIEDGEGFFIETDENVYLRAVEESDDQVTEGESGGEEDDVRKYVRTEQDDTPDDPLLQLEPCS